MGSTPFSDLSYMDQQRKRVPVTFIPAPTPAAPAPTAKAPAPELTKPLPVIPVEAAPADMPPTDVVRKVSLPWQFLVAILLGLLVWITYSNSFQSLWTLDNKYIIQLDPRNKLATYENVGLVWTQDYWWPKGISGLYRPIPTLTYLLNWAEPFSWKAPEVSKDSKEYADWRRLYTKAAGFDPEQDQEKYHAKLKEQEKNPRSVRFAEWVLSWLPQGGGPRVDGTQAREIDQVRGFHWVNLIFHWFNTVLVYFLALRVSKRFWVAVFTAALFGVHPISTESITNIIGRADLFATFSTLAVTLLYIRQTETASDWRRAGLLFLMVLAGLFGFFSKESSVAGIALLLLWDVAFRVRAPRNGTIKEWAIAQVRRIDWQGVGGLAYFGLSTLAVILTFYFLFRKDADPKAPDTVWPHVGRFIACMAVLVFRMLYLAMPKDSLLNRIGAGIFALVVTVWLGWLYTPAFWLLPLLIILDELALGTAIPAMRDWRDRVRPFVRWAMPYAILLPAVLVMFTVRHYVFFTSTPPEEPFLDNPLRGHPITAVINGESVEKGLAGNHFIRSRMTAVDVLGKQIWLLVWPMNLATDYSFDQIPLFNFSFKWHNVRAILVLFAILAVVAAAVWARIRGHRAIFFWVFLFFFNYGPTGNFLILIGSIMAERFMYLPLIGFAGAVVLGLDAVLRRGKIPLDFTAGEQPWPRPWWRFAGHGVLSVVVTLGAIRAYHRNFVWQTDRTLWEAAIQKSPRSFRCYQSLAFALFEESPRIYIDRMIRLDEEGLKLLDSLPNDMNSSRLYLHLGMYYTIKGDLVAKPDSRGVIAQNDEAMRWYEKAAFILERGSSIDRTFNEVNRARDIARGKAQSPDQVADVGLSPVYTYLSVAYMKLGRWEEARLASRYCIHMDPQDVDAYIRIAECYLRMGNPREAAVWLLQAILIREDRMDAWQMLVNIYNSINTEQVPPYIVQEGSRPKLVTQNSMVRDHLCSAYREFVRTFRLCLRDDLARQSADAAKNAYQFPAALFDPIFEEKLERPVPPTPLFYDPKKSGPRIDP